MSESSSDAVSDGALASGDVAPTAGSTSDAVPSPTSDSIAPPSTGFVVAGRYQLGELIQKRGPVQHFSGLDLGNGQSPEIPIAIRWQAQSPIDPLESASSHDEEPVWPSLAWERRLLSRSSHLSLPRVLDSFFDESGEYLILELPAGTPLCVAWDEVPLSWPRRCEWLIEIAEALRMLHRGGAIFDGMRPDTVVVTPMSQAVIRDLTGLLSLPLLMEPAAPVGGSLYSAPELATGGNEVDARADLYSFGAMVYALLLKRPLNETDFVSPGVPRPYLERDADLHPLLARLLARTFVHNVETRFPSWDVTDSDPTGFDELIETLKACSRSLAAVRLEIAGWTSTGVVRSGNEDAVAVFHGAETRLDDSGEFALIVLADGMGGHASGEVAASLTIQAVRDCFLRHPPFANYQIGRAAEELATHRQVILDALHEANRIVFNATPKEEDGGMGCTAEVVVIAGNRAIVGHVGDSRVYHCHNGVFAQITQDQTIVNQLVLLGQLTEDDVKNHPQRSVLQQAIGGHKEVYPDTYSLTVEHGDWLLVCSDGLTNHLRPADMVSIVEAAGSAGRAARRLVNQTILEGATDNVSVVVVRVS